MAYNEEDVIRERVENCLSVNYPTEKLEVIVASDGSTDATVNRARDVDGPVRVFDNPDGIKAETRNMAVDLASSDIVLFTDADTRYHPDAVRRHVECYSDPEVGAVSGTLVSGSFEENAIGKGMDVYWRWEYFMRSMQGKLGILTKMSGANMSMRKSFYRPVPDTMDIDQLAGLMAIRAGGKSLHTTDAIATEQFPTDPQDELPVRHRLTIRALTALSYHQPVFNPLSYPFLSIHVISYWLLRYLVPFLLVAFFAASLFSALSTFLIAPIVLLQFLFYTAALAAYANSSLRDWTPFSITFSYCWANLGVAWGVISYLRGTRFESY